MRSLTRLTLPWQVARVRAIDATMSLRLRRLAPCARAISYTAQGQRTVALPSFAPSLSSGATCYIDGAFSAASDRGVDGKPSTVTTASPRDGSALATLADASAADAERAIATARRCVADGSWGATTREQAEARARVLERAADALDAEREEFANLESLDCGKPLPESRADMAFCADVLRYYADFGRRFEFDGGDAARTKCPTDDQLRARVVSAPRGVVGMITPWNFPLQQAVVKLAPALAAGNACVLKPSPVASLTCAAFAKLLVEKGGAPAGAISVLTGGPPHGPPSGRGSEALAESAELDCLSFTGSGRAGEQLLAASARALRPTTLELGGKGALLVFADYPDLEAAADWALVGILSTSGQVCSATSRLLVEEAAYEPLLKLLLEKMKRVNVGDPMDAATTMGPLASAQQRDAVVAAVTSALESGAGRATVGVDAAAYNAGVNSGGFFFPPTLMTDVDEGSALWREEIFGPVLCVARFGDGDEAGAVARANDSPYGLGHGVLTADSERAARVANALDAGVVWANCNQAVWPDTPFGGAKKSGFGWELGAAGFEEYLQKKTIVEAAEPGYSWGAYPCG